MCAAATTWTGRPRDMDPTDRQVIRLLLDDYLRMYAGRDDRLTASFSEDFSGFTGGGDRPRRHRPQADRRGPADGCGVLSLLATSSAEPNRSLRMVFATARFAPQRNGESREADPPVALRGGSGFHH